MGNLKIANRYAEALMKEAEELHVLKEVSADLVSIRNVIRQSSEFRLFLKSPVIKNEKKREIFKSAFDKSIHELTLKFLYLLSEKERENDLSKIIEAFFRLEEEAMGIVRVDIKTAKELSDQQTGQLKSWFEAHLKKQVRLDIKVDSQLIGGFVAGVGDTMFDGSVIHQLELLRQRFKESPAAA
jgi:F-type H+-transporting ATPase subunit delta